MTRRTLDTHRSNLVHVIEDILQPTQLFLILVVGSIRPGPVTTRASHLGA